MASSVCVHIQTINTVAPAQIIMKAKLPGIRGGERERRRRDEEKGERNRGGGGGRGGG